MTPQKSPPPHKLHPGSLEVMLLHTPNGLALQTAYGPVLLSSLTQSEHQQILSTLVFHAAKLRNWFASANQVDYALAQSLTAIAKVRTMEPIEDA